VRGHRIETTVVAAVLGVALLLCQRTVAQAPADLQLAVAANARARSGQFELTTTSELTVRLEQAPAGDGGGPRLRVRSGWRALGARRSRRRRRRIHLVAPGRGPLFRHRGEHEQRAGVGSHRRDVQARRGGARTEFATVRVLFATNRTIAADSAVRFGSDPGADLSYGYCDVSIPRDHRLGELEAPSIWRLEFREIPRSTSRFWQRRPSRAPCSSSNSPTAWRDPRRRKRSYSCTASTSRSWMRRSARRKSPMTWRSTVRRSRSAGRRRGRSDCSTTRKISATPI